MTDKEQVLYTNTIMTITHPIVVLNLTTQPLKLRVPQESNLPALTSMLANPENTKNDLSLAQLTDDEREAVCRRQWLTFNEPLNHTNFVVIATDESRQQEEPVGVAGLRWIGAADENYEDESVQAGVAGVVLNPKAREEGSGSEVFKIAIYYGLKELGG